MPNIGWPELVWILIILAAIRLVQVVLLRRNAMVSLILGIPMLIVGFYLYTQAAPQWQQAQSWLAQFASALSPGVRDQIQQIQITYFGSIALMILGGVMTVIGAVRVFSVRIRD